MTRPLLHSDWNINPFMRILVLFWLKRQSTVKSLGQDFKWQRTLISCPYKIWRTFWARIMGKKVKKWVYQCSICVVCILALVIFDLGWPPLMTFDLQIRIESLFKLRRFAKADFCLGFTTDCVFGADFAVSSVFSEPVFSMIAWMARANKSLCCFANSVDWFFIVWLIFIYF